MTLSSEDIDQQIRAVALMTPCLHCAAGPNGPCVSETGATLRRLHRARLRPIENLSRLSWGDGVHQAVIQIENRLPARRADLDPAVELPKILTDLRSWYENDRV